MMGHELGGKRVNQMCFSRLTSNFAHDVVDIATGLMVLRDTI